MDTRMIEVLQACHGEELSLISGDLGVLEQRVIVLMRQWGQALFQRMVSKEPRRLRAASGSIRVATGDDLWAIAPSTSTRRCAGLRYAEPTIIARPVAAASAPLIRPAAWPANPSVPVWPRPSALTLPPEEALV